MCFYLGFIESSATTRNSKPTIGFLGDFEYSFGDVGSSKWFRQNEILIWSACSWWIVWFKEKQQHLALLPTLNGVSAFGNLFKTDLCAVWKRYQAIPLWCFFLFYSNLIKWNWKLWKYAWMVRTAGRARTSETHSPIIGNVLFRDIGIIVGFPHFQIWNMGSFYMSSLRFLSSLISRKWQQLPLKYRTF